MQCRSHLSLGGGRETVELHKANYTDVEPVAESIYFLRDALDCENLGITLVECEPGWSGKEHDHAENGQEEVYL
ncbi:MAG: hypothetical protein IH933_02355 [Euryarchaeota archaeon]|nr:hypothetical protein [Euryarchaeota archaeon]